MAQRVTLPRTRASVQAEASRPRHDGTMATLLDGVVVRMVQRGLGPMDALAEAGRAVTATSWASYRSGRNRLATMAASYLHWIAPGAGWQMTKAMDLEGRTGLCWKDEDNRAIIDVLDPDDTARELMGRIFSVASQTPGFVGVRLIRLRAPMTSLMFYSATKHEPLSSTEFWFEGRR